MSNRSNQQIKAKQFHQLHHAEEMLVFPNVWDCLGAKLLESLDYPAIATASASIAYTNGYLDGEIFSFDQLLELLKQITSSVNLPVTADIESGYATTDKQLEENIQQLIETGIVGINIEDTDKESGELYATETQCNRIRLIKKVSEEMGISLFINARTDVYIHDLPFSTSESKLSETIKRGIAYKNAGADCLFPIAIREKSHIQELVQHLQMPINILTIPGIPDLKFLKEIGVARVSLGPSFLKIAIKSMKDLATKLKDLDGLTNITENEVTNDYLKSLVVKK